MPARRTRRSHSAPACLGAEPYARRSSPEPPVTTIRAPPRVTLFHPPPTLPPPPSMLPAPTFEGSRQIPQAPSRDATMSIEGPIPFRMPWDVRMFLRGQRRNFNRENAAAGGTPLSSSPFLLSYEREAGPMRPRDSRQRARSLPREIERRLRRIRQGGVTKKPKKKSKAKGKKSKASRGKRTRPSREAAPQITAQAQAPISHPQSRPRAPSTPVSEGNRAGDATQSPHTGRLMRPMWLERLSEITEQRLLKCSENKENKAPRPRGTREANRGRDQAPRTAGSPPPGLNGPETGGDGGPRTGTGLQDPERRDSRGPGSSRSPVQPARDNENQEDSMVRGNNPVDVVPPVSPTRPVIPRRGSQLPHGQILLTATNPRAEMAFRRDVARLNRMSDRNFRRGRRQPAQTATPHQVINAPRQGLTEIPMNVLNNGPVQVRWPSSSAAP
ncbi:hypothetical protein Dda_6846 [Drechslerella dactyloides]|uniref:Uncharacterized protein n=1 Tax=Drechslerella dactyloides TaxID=74499 RepID=A0AAD6IYK2_DREDA|nr:hypothetical protein Dda_6846 [Drechslerella dactyloides]